MPAGRREGRASDDSQAGVPTCRRSVAGGVGSYRRRSAPRAHPRTAKRRRSWMIWPIDTAESPKRKESPQLDTEGSAVATGIDAAVVADHHVMVRRRRGAARSSTSSRCRPPWQRMELRAQEAVGLSGAALADGGRCLTAEATSMTSLPLALAMEQAAVFLALLLTQRSASPLSLRQHYAHLTTCNCPRAVLRRRPRRPSARPIPTAAPDE